MMNKKARVEGYFTVEAALIFPMVMFLTIVLMFVAFYTYDRSRLEHCAWEACMAGARNCHKTNEEAHDAALEAAKFCVGDSLFAVKNLDTEVDVNLLEVTVTYKCQVNMPFLNLVSSLTESDFVIEVSESLSKNKQVTVVRELRGNMRNGTE